MSGKPKHLPSARLEWTIDPRKQSTVEIVYVAHKVRPGLGRWHTRTEAKRQASLANDAKLRPVDAAWRNTERHAERMRKAWPRDWWKQAAEEYNRRHGR